jgi:hypothetical protein
VKSETALDRTRERVLRLLLEAGPATAAALFPQLCDAETAAIGRLLGTHVQRLATIAHGDGVCTTHIPRSMPRSLPKEGVHS